ncbi:2-succinyl-5-enolpyruvyl-6-hydroxy-3-cyclohexene-1-carboxylic-acid synthase [Candidatus Palauibacter soopunensis]|uniref:2-succinyl-5-enolpyruvyl-6-hydroxy-3- cyclohexene-1-carboxylic-acid synthase n=1 Tax=Candidatus Palauibacter soopunensis TaxID=3056739 RepID=UPI0023A38904|nr:2-succinyl-5-enolpyruvyl-6-hydroxy-3-cyclohexene-1-carboxylic-acid synthase [Candidatus Palauibacter soopunensis]MDE2878341.1 2-succinyl-5-enolpyruvyl-6-hydroxy-3-cyclohexene-1-carboxylic-acid synthase [Candidatus Palauibacter soopunensis]
MSRTPAAPNRNALWARALVDGLARRGASHACIGSGSRSAPLVEALAADDRFTLHPHVDERSAAFFALGVGAASGRPAAVVTTSGTAAANLFPAAVEASQSEIPFLALTADRPAALRGTDANQTIDQRNLFGRYARRSIDLALPEPTVEGLARLGAAVEAAWRAALGPPAGPAHLNVQFEKPLEPVHLPGDVPPGLEPRLPGPATSGDAPGALPPDAGGELAAPLQGARRPLIVCGPNQRSGIGRAALALAARMRAPLVADPLSGARFGSGAARWTMSSADLSLRADEVVTALRPDLVVRVGRAPTSAAVCRYLERHADAHQFVLDAAHRWRDHLATSARPLTGDPVATLERAAATGSGVAEEAWAERWRAMDRAARLAVEPSLAETWFEGAIADAMARSLPEGTPWFIGNSMPIRDVDAFARATDRPLRPLGLRGASGIDGNVSAALGAAAASGRPAAALIGDLTLLHDVGALLVDRPPGISLHLVVIQNRGGGIFHMLPIREHDPPFTPYVVMPQSVDLGAVAAAAGIPHRLVSSTAELREAMEPPGPESEGRGVRLTEARVEREHNWQQRAAAIESAKEAARREI